MPKITFLGAGSSIFAKNVLGDCILTPEIYPLEIALHDIDPARLEDSYRMLVNLNNTAGRNAQIEKFLDRRQSLQNADYVVNCIQVGGYDPCTVIDFEVPKKYGLRQTIGDTLGIGGIFRALRTIPVLERFMSDIEEICPNALFLNYTNPMAMLTGYMQRFSKVQSVGLCHSVQVCVPGILKMLGLEEHADSCKWRIAGINHQAWLLEIKDKAGTDLYPEIKRRARNDEAGYRKGWDLVRLELMKHFGYYLTESSEHNAEYNPWFIKSRYPGLIERFNIPLDELPARAVKGIADWERMRNKVVEHAELEHHKSHEFASYIIKAVETDVPYRIHGNVLNTGLITNLPDKACVEVPCMVDKNGINPSYVGDLPEQCAALNRTNINVQMLTIEAARTLKKDYIYLAAMMDPHTGSELCIDDIRSMCDELIAAHGSWLPKYR